MWIRRQKYEDEIATLHAALAKLTQLKDNDAGLHCICDIGGEYECDCPQTISGLYRRIDVDRKTMIDLRKFWGEDVDSMQAEVDAARYINEKFWKNGHRLDKKLNEDRIATLESMNSNLRATLEVEREG